MTFQDLNALAQLPFVRRVSASVTGRVQIVYADKNANTQVEGVNVDYAPMRALEPAVGCFFTDEEVSGLAKVAVLGTTVVKELFGDANPLGETLKINLINFTVIGILPSKGASSWRDQSATTLSINPTVKMLFKSATWRISKPPWKQPPKQCRFCWDRLPRYRFSTVESAS